MLRKTHTGTTNTLLKVTLNIFKIPPGNIHLEATAQSRQNQQ